MTIVDKNPRFRIVLLSSLVIVALGILVSLGAWQLQRKAWKEALIAQLDARSKMPTLSLDQAYSLWKQSPDTIEFRHVSVSGIYDHTSERHLISAQAQGAGWQIITPLLTSELQHVLVLRGIVPDPLKNPQTRLQSQPTMPVVLKTRVRLSELRTNFTPDNQPAKNSWYWRDGEALRASVSVPQGYEHMPFFLEALEPSSQWPKPDPTGINIRNSHLMYALTWFGLALTLVGVYGVMIWRALYPPQQ